MKRFVLSLFLLFVLPGFACAAVDLNSATKAELESVTGIGPVKAEAIIEYRAQHGPFVTVDDLKRVKGFGAKSVQKMRHEVTIGTSQAFSARKR